MRKYSSILVKTVIFLNVNLKINHAEGILCENKSELHKETRSDQKTSFK